MRILLLTAAIMAGALTASGPAAAAPASPSAMSTALTSDHGLLTQVRNDRRRWNRHHRRSRHRYWHRRYDNPPAGWHRYHRRPWNWQRRGCIAFGPIWYCP